MKKIFIKLISISLAVCMLFGITACKSDGGNGDGNNGDTTYNEILPEIVEPTVNYTQNDFIKNGRSDYKIVIPEEWSDYEYFAANELNTMLYESAKITLPIYFDNQIVYNAQDKYISLGHTTLLETLNVSIPTGLNEQGYVIKNVDNSLVITGPDKKEVGTLNGVYEFLYYQIGFEVFADDEVVVDSLTDSKLVNLDVVDQPDLKNTILNGNIRDIYNFRHRSRIRTTRNVFGHFRISPYHNTNDYVPYDTHKEAHSDWFSTQIGDGKQQPQLCYTARGDEKEYNLLVDEMFNQMLAHMYEVDTKILTITLEDNYNYCTCKACKDAEKYYGAKSGMLIKFCNDVSNKFKAYFAENDPTRTVDILFFAYYYFTQAPTKQVIECNDNVYPIICPYLEMDRAVSIHHYKNQSVKENIIQWDKFADRCAFWLYSNNFSIYLMPYDAISTIKENAEWFKQWNPVYYFYEGQGDDVIGGHTGFTELYNYLSAKTAWDTDVNLESETAKYFKVMYKDAAEPMYKYYTEYMLYLKNLNETTGYTQNLEISAIQTAFFPLGTLNSWKAHINDAYKAIEHYKATDMELYKKLQSRIALESVCVDFTTIRLHDSYFSSETLAQMKKDFFETCRIGKVRACGLGRDITDAFNH